MITKSFKASFRARRAYNYGWDRRYSIHSAWSRSSVFCLQWSWRVIRILYNSELPSALYPSSWGALWTQCLSHASHGDRSRLRAKEGYSNIFLRSFQLFSWSISSWGCNCWQRRWSDAINSALWKSFMKYAEALLKKAFWCDRVHDENVHNVIFVESLS